MVDFTGAFGPDAKISIKKISDGVVRQMSENTEKMSKAVTMFNNCISVAAQTAESLIEASGVRLREMTVVYDTYFTGLLNTLVSEDFGGIHMTGVLACMDSRGIQYTVSAGISETEANEEGFRNEVEITITRQNGSLTEILVPDREGRPCWAEAPVQEPGDGGEEPE